MNLPGLAFLRPARVYVEMTPEKLRAAQGDQTLEVPLERLANGRLSPRCREDLAARLKSFLKRKQWQLPASAVCALEASGISLRRLTLPLSSGEEWQRLLRLQIEAQFPLSPDELAWGCLPVQGPAEASTQGKQQWLVVAVRREWLEEYSNIFSECGMRPVFTLAGMARSRLCSLSAGCALVLNVGQKYSEGIALENQLPTGLRILAWGTDDLAIGEDHLNPVVEWVRQQGTNPTLFLTGADAQREQTSSFLRRQLGSNIEVRIPETEATSAGSAALAGLKQMAEQKDGAPPLILRATPRPASGLLQWTDPVLRRRLAVAILLLVVLLALPFAQAWFFKPWLARKVAVVQSQQGRLATIDRELDFLQYLKERQPPYVDALYLFAKAAPSGTRLDAVSMNRRGDISLSGSFRGAQQVVEFRRRLIKTRFFSRVSVEEQVPVPHQPKVNVRIIAHWQPASARALLGIGPSKAEIHKAAASHQHPTGHSLPVATGSPAPHSSLLKLGQSSKP